MMPLELTDAFPGLGKWLTLSTSDLTLPPRCCRCGTSTGDSKDFVGLAKATVTGVIKQFGGVEASVVIPIPFCSDCRREQRLQKLRGAAIGTVLGAALGFATAFTFPFPSLSVGVLLALRAVIALGCTSVGAAVGAARAGRNEPVRLRHYSRRHRTVEAMFLNPDYRRAVQELHPDLE